MQNRRYNIYAWIKDYNKVNTCVLTAAKHKNLNLVCPFTISSVLHLDQKSLPPSEVTTVLHFVFIIALLLSMALPLTYVTPNNIWTRFANCYTSGIILLFCDLSISMHVAVVRLVLNPLHENTTVYLFYSC